MSRQVCGDCLCTYGDDGKCGCMTKQPEALQYAAWLDGIKSPYAGRAAAELRRLYAENEALRGKQEPVAKCAECEGTGGHWSREHAWCPKCDGSGEATPQPRPEVEQDALAKIEHENMIAAGKFMAERIAALEQERERNLDSINVGNTVISKMTDRITALEQALREAVSDMRWIGNRCPVEFLKQTPHRIHWEAAHDAGARARATITKLEGMLP